VNECATGGHRCHVNAACTNTAGDHKCVCNTGYSGNGESCTDINECAAQENSPCHAKATCSNTAGGYTCECVQGYAGDGMTCKVQYDKTNKGFCTSVTKKLCGEVAKSLNVSVLKIVNPNLDRFPRGCYHKRTSNVIYYNSNLLSRKACNTRRNCICEKRKKQDDEEEEFVKDEIVDEIFKDEIGKDEIFKDEEDEEDWEGEEGIVLNARVDESVKGKGKV